jgi:deazaflavin-dependent oxidoreductase (nitroreductase family)
MSLDGEYVPSRWGWVKDQIEAYERSGGKEAATLPQTGQPVIVVTMLGAKTGKVRKIALMRVEHDGEYALVASKGGRPENPGWVENLRANPNEVTVQDGPEPFPVTVREVDGDERAAWWERSVAAFSNYAEYQEKTERRIPVFVATRR